MIAYELKKRVTTLNSYIKNLEKSIDNGNYTDAAFEIVLSKNKINNSILSPYNQKLAQKDALRYRNNKLKQQISDISAQISFLLQEPNFAAKLSKIQEEKNPKKNIPQRLSKQLVNCVDVQHKINLNDVNKLYYQRYCLSTDFEDVLLEHINQQKQQQEQQNQQKEQDLHFSFKNIIKATRRQNFVLVQYEVSMQNHYLMIQCKNIDHSLKIHRAFHFGQMIQKNIRRRKLFYTPQKTLQFEIDLTFPKAISQNQSNQQYEKKIDSQGSKPFLQKIQPKDGQIFNRSGSTLQNKQIQNFLYNRNRGITEIKPLTHTTKPIQVHYGSQLKKRDFHRKGSQDIRANNRKQSNAFEYTKNQNFFSGEHNTSFQNHQNKLNKFKSQNTFEDFDEVDPKIKNILPGRRIDELNQKRKELLEQDLPKIKINKPADNNWNNSQASLAQLHEQVNSKNYKFQNKRPERLNIAGIQELDQQKNSKSSHYREKDYQRADSIMENSYNMRYFDEHLQDQNSIRNKKYTYNTSSQNQPNKQIKNILQDEQILQSQNYDESDDLDPSNQSSPNIHSEKVVKISAQLQKIEEQSSPMFQKVQFPKKVQYATDQHLKEMPSKMSDEIQNPSKQTKTYNYKQYQKKQEIGYSFNNEQPVQQEQQMKQIDIMKKDKKNQSVNNYNQFEVEEEIRHRIQSKFSKSAGSNPQNNPIGNKQQVQESDDEEQVNIQEDQESESNEEDEYLKKSQIDKLKNGITVIKCSADGWKYHQKKLYLSQTQNHFCYQDTSNRKIQKFKLSDIFQILYPSYGAGIKRFFNQTEIDRNKCMIIKLKPCKATKDKSKDLQFISQNNTNEIKQFASSLLNFKQKQQKKQRQAARQQETSP